jgi:hypothetical protein
MSVRSMGASANPDTACRLSATSTICASTAALNHYRKQLNHNMQFAATYKLEIEPGSP